MLKAHETAPALWRWNVEIRAPPQLFLPSNASPSAFATTSFSRHRHKEWWPSLVIWLGRERPCERGRDRTRSDAPPLVRPVP